MHDPLQAFRLAMLAALGHAPDVIEPGKLQRFATRERHGNDDGWCMLFADRGGGEFGCWRQGIRGTWKAKDDRGMRPAERAAFMRHVAAAEREREQQQRCEWASNAKRIASLWAQCVPVREGDPVHRYLCRRLAVDDFAAPQCLRLHGALGYWHEGARVGTFPAMVAQVTSPAGRVLALHRTYLTDDGRKADLPGTEKKLTPTAGLLTGGSIRLASPRAGVLGVAEGIETALAASLASGVPTVVARDANGLAGYVWPAGVERLLIFADADDAGRDAADKLKACALRAWLRCDVMTPTDAGADWCDVWAARTVIEGAAA